MLARKFYTADEMLSIPAEALIEHGFMPKVPDVVDIELFAETIAHVEYSDKLPRSIWGLTQFRYHQKPIILINDALAEDKTPMGLARLRFVFAHECGHVLMQQSLYDRACDERGGESVKISASQGSVTTEEDYNGDNHDRRNYCWYEWQASEAGVALLIPQPHRESVYAAVLNKVNEARKEKSLRVTKRLIQTLLTEAFIKTFQVSRRVAEITAEKMIEKKQTLVSSFKGAVTGNTLSLAY